MAKVQSLADFLGTDAPTSASEELVTRPEMTVADFCKGVLESVEYRRSVLMRITLGTLPSAVEMMMYARAYGAVPEKVEHSGPDGKPIETITEVRRVIIRKQQPVEDESEAPQVSVH